MPASRIWPGCVLVAAIALASCNGGSRSQTNRDAPLPGGNDSAPKPTWYSKFLGLDKKPEATRSSATPEREPFIQPFDPIPSSRPAAAMPTTTKPTLALNLQVPPSVTPGQDLVVRTSARNTGSGNSSSFQISQPVPDSAQLIRTDPPASLQGSRLVWNFPGLGAGATQEVTAVYRPARAGFISLRSEANDREALLGSAQANVEVYDAAVTGIRPSVAQLAVRVRGPVEARTGELVTFDVNLTNAGQATVGPVQLVAELDPGLDHESGARRLEIAVPNMAAGETKSVQLPLNVSGSGRLRTVISATAAGGSARQECLLDVQAARLEIALTGPQRVMLGQPATWTLRVANPGPTPANGVTIRTQMPPELNYRGATQGGQLDRGLVVWSLGRLGPQDERTVQLTAVGGRPLERSTLVATALAERTPEARADQSLEVMGMPVLKVSLRGSEEAVEVGGKLIYAVELRNTGTLPVRDVNVAATFPAQLKPLFGAGPTIVRLEGQRASCGRVTEIAPGEALVFRIEAEALTAGDARVTVEATSAILTSPVIQDEATRIVGKR